MLHKQEKKLLSDYSHTTPDKDIYSVMNVLGANRKAWKILFLDMPKSIILTYNFSVILSKISLRCKITGMYFKNI